MIMGLKTKMSTIEKIIVAIYAVIIACSFTTCFALLIY